MINDVVASWYNVPNKNLYDNSAKVTVTSDYWSKVILNNYCICIKQYSIHKIV